MNRLSSQQSRGISGGCDIRLSSASYVPNSCTSTPTSNYSCISLQEGAVSTAERKYVNEFGNEIQKGYLKAGDDGHQRGDITGMETEAINHRKLQENLSLSGQSFRYTPAGNKAYAWNCLLARNCGVIQSLETLGRKKFDDNFYYDPSKCHYYLTPDAQKCLSDNKSQHQSDEHPSIVAPEPKPQQVIQQSGSGFKPKHRRTSYVSSFPESGTKEARLFADRITRNSIASENCFY